MQRYIKFFLHLFLRSSFAFTDQRKTSLTACLSQQNLRRGTRPLICPNPLRPRYINIFMSYFSTGRGLPVFLKYIPGFSSHHESFFNSLLSVKKYYDSIILLTADQDQRRQCQIRTVIFKNNILFMLILGQHAFCNINIDIIH